MTPEQKQQARKAIEGWQSVRNDDPMKPAGDVLAAMLEELINAPAEVLTTTNQAQTSSSQVEAPEPEPVARVTGYYAGYLSIATVDGRVLPAGTALYAAPPHQSEHHLEMVNTPEPEPFAWMVKNGFVCSMIYQSKKDADNYAAEQQKRHDLSGSLASFCVVPLYTAPPAQSVPDMPLSMEQFGGLVGLARDDAREKAIVYKATNIYGETCYFGVKSTADAWAKSGKVDEVRLKELKVVAAPTPAEAPADVARYRWLLKQAWFQQAADRFDLPDGGLQKRFEKCMDGFIDAAIAAEKGGA